jgi:DNA-binding GntR family transcriptional regulator
LLDHGQKDRRQHDDEDGRVDEEAGHQRTWVNSRREICRIWLKRLSLPEYGNSVPSMRRTPASSKPNGDDPAARNAIHEDRPLIEPNPNAPIGVAPRLYERVYGILARQIELGERAPGARLGESGLAAQFGVSRAPVRQALVELERNGLIGKTSGRGYEVLPPKGKAKAKAPTPDANDTAEQDFRLVSAASWERIYGVVESEIAARISFGCWRVNEAELARHYHVSRTVARDVVGRLQQRGILRKDDRSRWYAPALTPDHVRELYEMRWLLEPVALSKAAPHVPASVVETMRASGKYS